MECAECFWFDYIIKRCVFRDGCAYKEEDDYDNDNCGQELDWSESE